MTMKDAVLEMIAEAKEATSHLNTYSQDELESIYASAYHLYTQGNYPKATDLFMQLTLSNPYEIMYWKGLAGSYQMQSMWEPSLHAWALCSLLNEADPDSHFHAAECLFSDNQREEALKALALAKGLCKEEDPLLAKINLLQELCLKEVH